MSKIDASPLISKMRIGDLSWSPPRPPPHHQGPLPEAQSAGGDSAAQPPLVQRREKRNRKRTLSGHCFLETFLYLKFKTILLHTANCAL